VRQPSQLSRAGNRHLRSALYMPALTAIRWEPRLRGFYEHLVNRGKHKKQALLAVAGKLLHAIYGTFAMIAAIRAAGYSNCRSFLLAVPSSHA